MKASELKYHVEQADTESYFFDRKSMKFLDDTMANYGVRSELVQSEYVEAGVWIEVWELYRKKAVKHGNKSSAYFAKADYRQVHPKV
jgi:hypothetical protein